MDTMMDTATIDSTTGDSTATQSTESTGQGQVESHGSQGQTDNAGGEQSSSESGKEQGTEPRKAFRSKNQTIFELRQAVRERDAKLGELEQRFSQFEQKFQPRQERKPSRTFWEAPEEVLDERMTSHLSEMEKRIYDRMEQRDTQTQESTQWKQEASQAAELIKSHPGITDDDILDIQEIVRSNPAMQKMRPLERAEYAKYLWEKDRGISDKTGIKNKAASVQGTPPSAGGKRIWTKADMEAEAKKFPNNPGLWTPEQNKAFDALEAEFRTASREGRVRN